jgi:hypothetical protein
LASFDDEEVFDIQFDMLGSIVILLGYHDAILEEVFINCAAVFLGDNHSTAESKQGQYVARMRRWDGN